MGVRTVGNYHLDGLINLTVDQNGTDKISGHFMRAVIAALK